MTRLHEFFYIQAFIPISFDMRGKVWKEHKGAQDFSHLYSKHTAPIASFIDSMIIIRNSKLSANTVASYFGV